MNVGGSYANRAAQVAFLSINAGVRCAEARVGRTLNPAAQDPALPYAVEVTPGPRRRGAKSGGTSRLAAATGTRLRRDKLNNGLCFSPDDGNPINGCHEQHPDQQSGQRDDKIHDVIILYKVELVARTSLVERLSAEQYDRRQRGQRATPQSASAQPQR